MAQHLSYTWIMEVIQDDEHLLSEKQAAARLGVARITLLRARVAGRIRYFRIGARVLYCEEHLADFLKSCERNGQRRPDGPEADAVHKAAKRRNNRATSLKRKSVDAQKPASPGSAIEPAKGDQGSLPFSARR